MNAVSLVLSYLLCDLVREGRVTFQVTLPISSCRVATAMIFLCPPFFEFPNSKQSITSTVSFTRDLIPEGHVTFQVNSPSHSRCKKLFKYIYK